MRRGIKRASVFEDGEREERVERVKITVVEPPKDIKNIKVEEAVQEFKIPEPSKNSFLLKAIERKSQNTELIDMKELKELKEMKEMTEVKETKEFEETKEFKETAEEDDNLEKRAKKWLKSLGWKEGQAVGKGNKDRPASPVLLLLSRPQYLGLGAKPPSTTNPSDKRKNDVYVDREGREVQSVGIDERLRKYKGEERMVIREGIHKGLSGRCISRSERKVKLDLNGMIVTDGEAPEKLQVARIGLLVRILRREEEWYYRIATIMDVFSDEAVIVKCHNQLLQLPLDELACVHPEEAGQRVFIYNKDRTGIVQGIDGDQCTVMVERTFISVALSDCCVVL